MYMPYPVITKADLLSQVPLKPNDDNVMSFVNAAARESYFNGKVFMAETNIQYMKEQDEYKVNANYDDVIANCNYLRFNNENRWFYAFIMEVRYINPSTCAITFQIDYWTTYQFDLQWKNCFIEREHVTDDTIGKHTIDEGLYTGENIITELPTSNMPYTMPNGNAQIVPVVLMSEFVSYEPYEALELGTHCNTINMVPQPSSLWVPLKSNETYDINTITQRLAKFLKYINSSDIGKGDAAYACFSVPYLAFDAASSDMFLAVGDPDTDKGTYSPNLGFYLFTSGINNIIKSSGSQVDYNFQFNDNIGSYTPKNNKLYTYPYYYYIIDNNQGNQNIMYREYITGTTPTNSNPTVQFRFTANIAPDSSLFCIVNSGYGANAPKSNTLSLNKFPKSALNSNFYNNWLAGHSASMNVATASAVTNAIIPGLAGGNGAYMASGIVGGFFEIASLVARDKAMQVVPDNMRGNIANTANTCAGRMGFTFYKSILKSEIYEMIDNFFTMYGYKVNRVGTPSFRTRQYYNYYKLPVCNVFGNVPGEGIKSITEMFQNGVTVWNTTDVGNYRNGVNPIV